MRKNPPGSLPQILNFDIGEQPESARRSKFAGLKFGNDFNLMDDEDDDF